MTFDAPITARRVLLALAAELEAAPAARELMMEVAKNLQPAAPSALHELPTSERTEVGLLCSRAMYALEAGLLPQLDAAEREQLQQLLVTVVAAALAGEAVELVDVALSERAAAAGEVH